MPKCDVNHLREFIANNFLFSAEFSLGDEDSFMEAGSTRLRRCSPHHPLS